MIKIDPEFRDLIPPLSAEEFQQLEENCVKDGIRDFLTVWPQEDGSDILIDGHNRWSIIGRHPNLLRPLFNRIQFESREAAKEWIIKNQLGRRNIPAFVRAELALKLKPVIAEKAKERMLSGKSNPEQKSAQGRTNDELAKAAGVSHDTIHKVEVIEEKASDEAKQALRKGEASINQVYVGIIASENENKRQKEARELREAKQRFDDYQEQTGKITNFETAKQHKEDGNMVFNDLYNFVADAYVSILRVSGAFDQDINKKALALASKKELDAMIAELEGCHKFVIKSLRILSEVTNEKQL